MGLLDRAQILDSNQLTEGPVDPAAMAAAIVASFPHSRENIDYPGEVYESFRKLLGFHKGSMLFPDERHEEYYPWITTGLDRTSSRRMRISFNFPPLMNNPATMIEGLSPENLAPMLSNREFGLIGSSVLVRLGTEGRPTALILAMDCLRSTQADPRLSEAVDTLNENLGDGIARSRALIESAGEEESMELSQWLSTWGDQQAVLVSMDATNAIDSLLETVPGLELYRARRDVVSLIGHITGRMGRMYDLKDGRVLILFPAERMSDHGLYIHQLRQSFAAAFHKISYVPDFPADFYAWPKDRDRIEKSLTGYF